jgi:hypothetical protein
VQAQQLHWVEMQTVPATAAAVHDSAYLHFIAAAPAAPAAENPHPASPTLALVRDIKLSVDHDNASGTQQAVGGTQQAAGSVLQLSVVK